MSRNETELTLKDRLSRLTYAKACKLLGPNGDALIRQGGKHEIDMADAAFVGDDLFRVCVGGAIATITTMAESPQRLRLNCTRCTDACEHIGGAVSLVLEEKMTLGLAAPPPERVPIESLDEDELIRHAVEERRERARKERMTVRSMDSSNLWTDYLVANTKTGKTYRVALRGWEEGESYCSCPDFRKSTLGVCKHILNVQRKMKARFPAAVRRCAYRRKNITVHMRYGRELELRVALPTRLDNAATRIVRPLRDCAIRDIPDLLKRVRKLIALGQEVTIYPDAEEYIDRKLRLDRIAATVADIRKNPKKHPLRKELLKTELLPYQMDGIAFAVGAGRAILADDMGLGKTIQGIGVAEMLAREAAIARVLIVCPASLKSQWRNEITRFSGRDVQLVLGKAEERARQYDTGCFFTVCNYEQVLRDFLPIEKTRWDLIILDEGQRIKNWESQTSRVIKGLKSPFALALSGTPLENRLGDLFSITEFIDDRRLAVCRTWGSRFRRADPTPLARSRRTDERRRLDDRVAAATCWPGLNWGQKGRRGGLPGDCSGGFEGE